MFIYITCEIFSLIFVGKHKRYHNVYFDISWILWDVSGMINYIIMLVVTEMLYQSFQETYGHSEEDEESDEEESAVDTSNDERSSQMLPKIIIGNLDDANAESKDEIPEV